MAAVLAVLCGTFDASGAAATGTGGEYGEISRFGGYSESPEPGKFVLPVGFAVDPSEGNAVYVLDRVMLELGEEGEGEEGTTGKVRYRLQKINPVTKTVEASALLPVEEFTRYEFSEISEHPMMSLAVDSAEHRVYALVESIVNTDKSGGVREAVPVVQRLVAWNTVPQAGKLVPAEGFETADSEHAAALVAGPAVLEPTEPAQDLYLPEALAVDANHNVVIEAQEGVRSGPIGGPTVLQQIKIEGSKGKEVGVPGEKWTVTEPFAAELKVGDGLFPTASGLAIGLWNQGEASRLVEVGTKLSEPNPTLIAPDEETEGNNADEAVSVDNEAAIAYPGQYSNELVLQPYAPGSPIAQLTSGLYAARYGERSAGPQAHVEPWIEEKLKRPFWYTGYDPLEEPAREGVRLFEKDGNIVTTLGGEQGQPCNIDAADVALAAGSGGTVFALTQPDPSTSNSGDEVVEFGPNPESGKQCLTDTRSVEARGQKEAKEITVAAGVKVSFRVRLSKAEADTPFEFAWDFGDGSKETHSMEAPTNYTWPSPIAEHTYTVPRREPYEAKIRVYGALGTSEIPVKVTVLEATPPTATFTPPSGEAEQPIAFDGSGSTAAPGTLLSECEFEWNFGDGTKPVKTVEVATTKHVYAKKGTYNVTLKVTDLGQSSEITHQVVVSEDSKERKEREERETKEHEANNSGGGGQSSGSTQHEREQREAEEHAHKLLQEIETLTNMEKAGGTKAQIANTITPNGLASITVSCPTGYKNCTGHIELRTTNPVNTTNHKHKTRPLTIGSTTFTLPGGTSKHLNIHLSTHGLALLRHNHTIHTTLILTTTAYGTTHTTTTTTTLHLTTRRKH